MNGERSFLEMLSNTDQWARCCFGQGPSDHSVKTNLSWCSIVDRSHMIISWVLLDLLSRLMKSHLITFLIKKPARQPHRSGELKADVFFFRVPEFILSLQRLSRIIYFPPSHPAPKDHRVFSLYFAPLSISNFYFLSLENKYKYITKLWAKTISSVYSYY